MRSLRLAGRSNWFGWAALCLMASFYIAHLGLLQLGHWQDEYQLFAEYRASPVAALVHRLVTWSPRLVSELLVYLYFLVTEYTGRPLLAEVLASAWLLFVLPVVLYAVQNRGNHDGNLAVRNCAAFSIPILCVLGAPLNEMFLWPMAALAYVPGIASIMTMLFLVASTGQFTPRRWIALSVIGTIGALSVELTSVVCAIFFFLLLCVAWLRGDRETDAGDTQVAVFSCLPPILSALLVCILVKTHRAEEGSPLSADLTYVHHGWNSFAAAMPTFLRSLIGDYSDGYQTPRVLSTVDFSLCFTAGIVLLSDVFAPGRSRLRTSAFGALAIACFSGFFISVFATFYQFGMVCCERHDSFRDCLQVIGLAAFGLWVAQTPFIRIRSVNNHAGVLPLLGVTLLGGAYIILLPGRLVELRTIYQHFHEIRSSIKETSASGNDRAMQSMIYVVPPAGLLIGEWTGQSGTLHRGENVSWNTKAMLDYFQKEQVTFKHLTFKNE